MFGCIAPADSACSEEKRLEVFTRLLAVFVLLCIGFSWKLWISSRLYPLVPVFDFIPALPYPFDYVLLGMLCAVLCGIVVRPRSKLLVGLVLAGFAFLFLQDQNRIWPSFYEFFFLFLLLITHRANAGADEAHRILTGMRFVLAAVYFWSGLLKLNPRFFNETFPWFLQPLTDLLPFQIPHLPTIAVFGALFEVLFGIGLLTRRFRTFALYDAMLMHALIFFLIGPLRNNWNSSAWIWSAATAVLAWTIFRKAPAFQFREMFGGLRPHAVPAALAVVFIGILPLLNNVNLWDSALSFNIYTGNVSRAEISMYSDDARHLPRELSPFITVRSRTATLDINAWTGDAFNANPYPEKRIFKAVLGTICSHLPLRSAQLFVQEKSGWFIPRSVHHYRCAGL